MAQPQVFFVGITATPGAQPQRFLRSASTIWDVVCAAASTWPDAAHQEVRVATDIEQLQRLGMSFPRAATDIWFELPQLADCAPMPPRAQPRPTRRTRRRTHPLTALVLWLGTGLCATLMALVWTLGQLPGSSQLQTVHHAGMKYGYELCMAWQEQEQEAKAAYLAGGL